MAGKTEDTDVTAAVPGGDLAVEEITGISPVATAEMESGQLTSSFAMPLERSAQLVVLVGPEAGRLIRMEGEGVIGRSKKASVQITGEDVSRMHARISLTPENQFVIEDLGSRNGTCINGIPIKKQLLKIGDKVTIGTRTTLLFTLYDGIEEQLLQLQKMEALGRLASGVAHDFNNLLGSVTANLNYLKTLDHAATLGDGEVREVISDLEEATQRAVELVRQLLGFARRGKFTESLTDITSLVQEVVSLLTRTFGSKYTIESHVEPDLYSLGDRSQLHQVLINLLINARDAMPQGGRVTLQAVGIGGEELGMLGGTFLLSVPHVQISVQDTGMGMDEDTRRRIFDPFFTTKEPGKGVGLGLAMVYGIVKNHAGHVEVHSEPGQGSTFIVFLPRANPHLQQKGASDLVQTTSAELKHMLVVDDEEAAREATARMLRSLGFPVLVASGGMEAVNLVKEHGERINLVLMDLRMPGMDGADTFFAIRRLVPGIRIIICAVKADEEHTIWLQDTGACVFLPKPFNTEQLGETISGIPRHDVEVTPGRAGSDPGRER